MSATTATPLRAVLLGDEDEHLVQQLAHAAASDGGLQLSVAPDVTVLGQVAADVVLLGIDDDAPFPADTVREIRANSNAPIAIVAATVDAELLQRAATAGVADVVIAEQPADHLAFALRRAAMLGTVPAPTTTIERARSESRQVTVVALKGGAGASTVAVNLATTYAGLGLRTLLVDLDLYGGDLALAIGAEPVHTIADVAMSSGDLDIEKLRGHATSHESGLDVLAAPLSSDDAPLVRVERIHDLLRVARDGWDMVVVDTGSVLDEHLVVALEASDDLLVVTSPDAASLRAARRALRAAEGFGFPTYATRLVLNRAGASGGLAASDAADAVGHAISWRVPEDPAVNAAWNSGRPVAFDRQGAPASRAFTQLATDLLPEDGELRARTGRPRRLSRSLRRREPGTRALARVGTGA
jgi:pilus assembly protein CpaE